MATKKMANGRYAKKRAPPRPRAPATRVEAVSRTVHNSRQFSLPSIVKVPKRRRAVPAMYSI